MSQLLRTRILPTRHLVSRVTNITRHISSSSSSSRILPTLGSLPLYHHHHRSFHTSRPLHHAGSTSSSSSSFTPTHPHPTTHSPTWNSLISDLITILRTNVPRGFKNFFPQENKPSSSSPPNNENKPSEDPSKPSSPQQQQQQQQKQKSNNSSSNQSKNQKNEPEWDMGPTVLIGGLFMFYLLTSIVDELGWGNGSEITWQEFKTNLLEMGRVERIDIVEKRKAIVHVRKDVEHPTTPNIYFFTIGSIDNFESKMEDIQHSMGIEPKDYIPIKYISETHLSASIGQALWTGILMYMLFLGYRGMKNMSGSMSSMGGMGGGGRNIFSIGKSPATVVKPGERTKITFKDVAGLDEAKVEVMEFVEFLKNPSKFTKLGAKVPKGALLVGPPGTGKTLLAKATAGEASVPFFSISGSDFIEMFVGVGPSRVRDLFAQARQNAPCIIFIDEIDAVGRQRGKGNMGGHDERENTLNQLLVEMDGFNPTEGIVVLAGTNRKDVLDPALLRPGRFDRQIQVDIPDIKGRAQIFAVHLKPIKVTHDRVDLAQRLAALTPGFSGADIANLCNEAALIAARAGKEIVELVDFESATDRIIGGMEKKYSVMTKAEKKLVAYHEAGHVVAGWFLEHANPVLKVTIVPRSNGALGFAQHLPKELSLYQQEQLMDMMCMTLGGRASEQVFFDKISTGAADDLNKVTKLAQAQVSVYGMSKKLGNVSYHSENENSFVKPFSEATAQTIDEEIRSLIAISYERTLELIREKREQVEKLAEKLLEVETVNHDLLVSILGPRPFTNDAYNEYRKNARKDTEQAQQAEVADGPNEGEGKTPPGPAPIPALNPA